MAIASGGFRLITREMDKASLVGIRSRALEESAYDLVFARYLLSHLPRPQRAVELMVRALRPGGRLVLEDVFFPGQICYPSNAAFDRFVELYQAVARMKEGYEIAPERDKSRRLNPAVVLTCVGQLGGGRSDAAPS
jgi:SAM-dependent methyltransferase